MFSTMLDISCFSHTHLNTPVLEGFVKVWINMFPKNKAYMIDKDWVAYSYILSYSVVVEVGGNDDDVKSFLEDEDLPPSQLKLLEIP